MVSEDLSATQTVATQILKRASLSAHEFILMGRSPTMLGAWFEASRYAYPSVEAWTLPISLKNSRQISFSELVARFETLENSFRANAYEHRPRVYIDAITSGRTLIALDRILSRLNRWALLIGFSDDVVSARRALNEAHLVNPFELIEVPHEYMMHLARHKQLAPFDSIDIEQRVPPLAIPPRAAARFLICA